jgi:hypothetical protein
MARDASDGFPWLPMVLAWLGLAHLACLDLAIDQMSQIF